jgi:anti-anti-sigma factor
VRIAAKRIVGDVVILDLKGRADVVGCTDEIVETVKRLGAAGHLKVLLNLALVTSWSASGGWLGVLVRSYVVVKRKGGLLKLLKPGRQLRDLLEATGLAEGFELYEDEGLAVGSFASLRIPTGEEPEP